MCLLVQISQCWFHSFSTWDHTPFYSPLKLGMFALSALELSVFLGFSLSLLVLLNSKSCVYMVVVLLFSKSWYSRVGKGLNFRDIHSSLFFFLLWQRFWLQSYSMILIPSLGIIIIKVRWWKCLTSQCFYHTV